MTKFPPFIMDRVERGLQQLANSGGQRFSQMRSTHTRQSVNALAHSLLTKIEAYDIEGYRDQPSAFEKAIQRWEEGR